MAQPPEYPRIPRPPPSADELVYDDGEPMETARHVQQMMILIGSLEHAWRDCDDFYVGGNMFLYFSETQARKNDFRGPDVFVVLDTTRRERRAWVVWEEDGKTPDVIIELLSESTAKVDRGEKMQIYSRLLKVGEYFLFDPFTGVLEGHVLDPLHGGYRPKQPDAAGRLRCERMGLYLAKVRSTLHAVDTDWLRWVDADGHVLPVPSEAAAVEVHHAESEARRADAETRRADAETRRAESEARRADAEGERADRLAAELEALKAYKPR